jgi:Holliday junction DNA helicase RuvA
VIDFLRGRLLIQEEEYIVLDVNGVGYGVLVKPGFDHPQGPETQEIELWVRTYVREDLLKLYGFTSRHERDMFDLLIGMPGIGPSLGIAILSALTLADIIQAVHEGDTGLLRSIRGVGPRMADKLLLELKSRIGKMAEIMEPGGEEGSVAAIAVGPGRKSDAVNALVTLGVRPPAANRAITQAAGMLGKEASTEDLVREGLKHR